MSRRLRITLNIVLLAAVLICAGVLLRQQLQWRDSSAATEKAAAIVHAAPAPPAQQETSAAPAREPAAEPGITAPADPADPADPVEDPADPVAEELLGLDLDALRAINPDVAGWIIVPGADVSHPILQGADNDYYLHHTWEKKWNSAGSIFLDWRSSRDFEGFHTIIYGHRMRNGSMFGLLHRYAGQDVWTEHPYIYIADGACVRRYQIFAAWEPSVTSAVYAQDLDSGDARQELIAQCLRGSAIDTGLVPGPEDKLLTLSTCTGNGHATRWVVQARLEKIYPEQ